MVMVLLTEILHKVRVQFRSLEMRIEFILETLHSNLV